MFTTIKKFKYLGCEIFYENDNDIQQVAKFTQIREVLTALLKPNSVQKFSRIEVYNTLALPIFSMWKRNLDPQIKGQKSTDINREEFFSEEQQNTNFLIIERMKKLWKK